MRKDELREAAEVATRAFDDYEYFTNWSPEKQERKGTSLSIGNSTSRSSTSAL